MADDGAFPAKTLEDWTRLAQAELRGKSLDSLDWTTPEGIRVKPLYTAADLEAIEAAGFPLYHAMPGFPPYLRGPRATMYANPRGRSGNIPGSRPRRSRTAFIARI